MNIADAKLGSEICNKNTKESKLKYMCMCV